MLYQDVDVDSGRAGWGALLVLVGADDELVAVGGFVVQRDPRGDDTGLRVDGECVGVAFQDDVGDLLSGVRVGGGDLHHFQTSGTVLVDFGVIDPVDELQRKEEAM